MTSRGGRIAPDGRPPQTPGVGKNAKRHDLEAPATPGLHGSDLQQGDVSMLEQGQRVAPRPKRNQPAASAQPRPSGQQTVPQPGQMQVPDAIQFASQKIGGQNPAQRIEPMRRVDPTPWLPLMQSIATRPNGGGAIAATLMDLLRQYRANPVIPEMHFIDTDEIDAAIAMEL